MYFFFRAKPFLLDPLFEDCEGFFLVDRRRGEDDKRLTIFHHHENETTIFRYDPLYPISYTLQDFLVVKWIVLVYLIYRFFSHEFNPSVSSSFSSSSFLLIRLATRRRLVL